MRHSLLVGLFLFLATFLRLVGLVVLVVPGLVATLTEILMLAFPTAHHGFLKHTVSQVFYCKHRFWYFFSLLLLDLDNCFDQDIIVDVVSMVIALPSRTFACAWEKLT